MTTTPPSSQPRAIRGRGASANLKNRFESHEYVPLEGLEDFETGSTRTEFYADQSKSILSSNDSPDVGFDRGINPYRGCEHGCAYCFARPTHEYLGLSAGRDFETKIFVKERAPELLRKALSSPKWTPQPIGLSGATDAYQPVERRLGLTRKCLEVLRDFRNPVIIITKNKLVTRDIDILSELARHKAAGVMVSVTTLDLKLNRILEPRSSSPKQRLEAIRALNENGIPVGVLAAPMIPALTDHELPNIIAAARDAGAQCAGYIALRLPWTVAPLFERWLEEHYPARKDKVLNRIRSIRGGRLNDPRFGNRQRGEGPFAEQMAAMFQVACNRAGISGNQLDVNARAFRRPSCPGDQMALL